MLEQIFEFKILKILLINKKYKLKNITDADAKKLPESLGESIKLFKESKLMIKLLGKDSFNALIKNKEEEWGKYKKHVSNYELENYLSIL